MELNKILGEGRTAVVYEWGENRALKLFHSGHPKESIAKEFNNARAIRNLSFDKPKAYE